MSRSLLCLMLIALGCGHPVAAAEVPAPRTVTPAELKAWLTTSSGRPRVVDFWATWCGPCVAELPALRQLAATHPEIEVVLVNVDDPSVHPTKVLPMIASRGLDRIPHLLLNSRTPAADLQATVPGWRNEIPFTIFQDARGAIVEAHATPMALTELEAAAAKLTTR